jgi:hypothetical protein
VAPVDSAVHQAEAGRQYHRLAELPITADSPLSPVAHCGRYRTLHLGLDARIYVCRQGRLGTGSAILAVRTCSDQRLIDGVSDSAVDRLTQRTAEPVERSPTKAFNRCHRTRFCATSG